MVPSTLDGSLCRKTKTSKFKYSSPTRARTTPRPDAASQGITRRTFELAFAGLSPDARVIVETRRQPECGKAVGAYIKSVASKSRVEAGIRKAKRWSSTLTAIENTYGVERGIVLAIWGIETSYGEDNDRWDVIR